LKGRLDIMTNAEKALQLHEEWNGKFETTPKMKIQTREDLALAYTPGVAEPCKVIAKDKEAAYKYTIKSNTIAVVSDGSAVLGLGNIGICRIKSVNDLIHGSLGSLITICKDKC